ncbi:MAG: hypothetical protein Kow0090_14290 [Myxococcota bacterium]
MRIIKTLILLIATLLASAGYAQNSKIYLNGVEITGISNQKFENVTVELDNHGNILIIAPQYRVKSREEVAPPTSASQSDPSTLSQKSSPSAATNQNPPGKRFYLVTYFSPESRADFDVDIFVNGKFYKRILSQDDQVIEEISSLMSKGENKIAISATKNVVAGAPLSTPDSFLQIIIGEAKMQGNQVIIEKPYVNYRLTGAQSGTIHKNFTVTAE